MTKVVGIDLGTTNSCIVIIEGGQSAGATLYLKRYLKRAYFARSRIAESLQGYTELMLMNVSSEKI